MIHRLVWTWTALLALTLGGTAQATAQVQLASRAPRFVRISPVTRRLVDASHAMILKREMSLNLDRSSLADALDEISRTAGIKLIYSRDLVPLEMPVTLQAATISLGAALTAVLFDTGLDVVISSNGEMALMKKAPISPLARAPNGSVSGRVTDAKTETGLAGATVIIDRTSLGATTDNDGHYRIAEVPAGRYTVRVRYIGYAPTTASVSVNADQEATADFVLERSAQRLDEVVTTGTVIPTEVKALPTPISVVTGDEIEKKGYQRVDQIFRGDIPGALAWDVGAGGYSSSIDVRGAGSLGGLDYVKTYIDGVEVADPTYIATIDPNSIERIEILRGPQGSTIYGSQALSGVMQIFTKKGNVGTTRPQVEVKASAGVIESAWKDAVQQDHSVAVTGGGTGYSYRVGGRYLHNGDWVPEAASTDGSIYGGLLGVQGPMTVEFSGRYYNRSFGFPINPAFQGYTYFSKPFNSSNALRQQTYSLGVKYAATPSWRHSLVLGYDRTAFDDYSKGPRFTTPADSFLVVFTSDRAKASLAYNTTYDVSLGRAVQSSLAAGADYWIYNAGGFYAGSATRNTNSIPSPTFGTRSQYHNAGYFAQVQLALLDAAFVTAGLRAEDNSNFGAGSGLAWAPRVGASFVHTVGGLTAKARVAYGRAIRPPPPGAADAYSSLFLQQVENPNLGPERQQGVDAGLDLYFGHVASLEATYYNQTASDLIDLVLLDASATPAVYQNQNVGKVKNKGWELQANLNASQLSLTGTFSATTSVVDALSPTYTGDLQPGDQLLHIPKYAAGARLTYASLRTQVSLGMTHVASWTEQDLLALYGFYYGGLPYRGSGRAYWVTYPSFTKFNLSVSQAVAHSLTVFVRSDNLTNQNVSELYNLNVTSGRAVVIGVRTKF